MDPALKTAIVIGVVELLAAPIIVFMIKRAISKRLDDFDERREEARAERAENERRKMEQREAERGIVLAIARTMLLDNYEKCVAKGYYSREEREIFSLMYKEYKLSNGNGVIDTIAERIRELPLEPHENDKHHHQDF